MSAAVHAEEFSRANKLLFMTDQIVDLPDSISLPYHFTRSSTLDDSFEDDINVRLVSAAGDGARTVDVEYFSGARQRHVPTFSHLRGNPVLTLFLQRDVNEMARQTQGSWRHFQRRIKLALEESADIQDTTILLDERELIGQKITIDPFRDDPQRKRYEKFADKTYQFVVSPHVPGFIFQISSRTLGSDGKEMIVEILEYRGKA